MRKTRRNCGKEKLSDSFFEPGAQDAGSGLPTSERQEPINLFKEMVLSEMKDRREEFMIDENMMIKQVEEVAIKEIILVVFSNNLEKKNTRLPDLQLPHQGLRARANHILIFIRRELPPTQLCSHQPPAMQNDVPPCAPIHLISEDRASDPKNFPVHNLINI